MEIADKSANTYRVRSAEVVGARLGALLAGREDLRNGLPDVGGEIPRDQAETVVVSNMLFLKGLAEQKLRIDSYHNPFDNIVSSTENTILSGIEALEAAIHPETEDQAIPDARSEVSF